MKLEDIKTLKEVSDEYGISIYTLQYRLKDLEEGTEYKKLRKGQSTILSPLGVKKIIEGVNKQC